jgi:hypothetical protein
LAASRAVDFGAFVDALVVLVVDIEFIVWAAAGAAMTASAARDAINAFIGFLLLISAESTGLRQVGRSGSQPSG